jgi:GNAT superfamily N-acetyltransferase
MLARAPLPTPPLVIRPLTATDSIAYRALRQNILKTSEARYFSDSYDRERQLTESEWLAWCTETPEHCILGTFAGTELVGVIMVTRQGGSISPVVEWEAVWIDPCYRGMGLGRSAYEHARQWSRSQGYQFVVTFIRADNMSGLGICRNQGFISAYSIEDELWADGSIADTRAYLLNLRVPPSAYSSKPNFDCVQEALPFLKQGLHAPSQQDDRATLQGRSRINRFIGADVGCSISQ